MTSVKRIRLHIQIGRRNGAFLHEKVLNLRLVEDIGEYQDTDVIRQGFARHKTPINIEYHKCCGLRALGVVSWFALEARLIICSEPLRRFGTMYSNPPDKGCHDWADGSSNSSYHMAQLTSICIFASAGQRCNISRMLLGDAWRCSWPLTCLRGSKKKGRLASHHLLFVIACASSATKGQNCVVPTAILPAAVSAQPANRTTNCTGLPTTISRISRAANAA